MSLVRPSFHAFTLAMLACACLLVAQLVNTVVSTSLTPLPSAPESSRLDPAKIPAALATSLSAEQLARYLDLSLEAAPTTTLLGLKLLGTMTSPSADLSLASVFDDASQRTRTVWVGSALQGAEVLTIERTRVILVNGGRTEILDITSIPAAPGPATAPPPPAARASGFGATLRQTGPEAYTIQRQDVENTLANLNEVVMQGRVAPSFRNGVPNGFKLFAMKPDSLYTRLGMKNGDIVHRVNGFSLDSPTRALEAYGHLRDASRIELEIERDGQPLRKTYTVEN